MIPQTVSHIVAGEGRKSARRVLVVDDVPEIGELLRATFRRLPGLTVQAVVEVRSERAIDRLQHERFDLVITDHRMPTLSGDAVIEAARATQPGVPIVLMSGSPEALATPREGIAALLAKPLDHRSLVTLLSALLAAPAAATPGKTISPPASGQLPARTAYPPKRW